MSRLCCFADIHADKIALLAAVLRDAGEPIPATLMRLDVGALGKLDPGLLVCDVDHSDVDPFEVIRQLRFVLPTCTIAVYTMIMERSFALACHLAGANCLLLKDSSEADLSHGIRIATDVGCFTDPRFSEQ